MVLRNSICNLSKYSIKNDEILTPVLSETLFSDIKSIFSNPMGYRTQVSIGKIDVPKNILRSKSFNSFTQLIASTECKYMTNSYRRASSLCLTRDLGTKLPLSGGIGTRNGENSLSNTKIRISTMLKMENGEFSKKYDLDYNKKGINERNMSEKVKGYDTLNGGFSKSNNGYNKAKILVKEPSMINESNLEKRRSLMNDNVGRIEKGEEMIEEELIETTGEIGSYRNSRSVGSKGVGKSLAIREEVASESAMYTKVYKDNKVENTEYSESRSNKITAKERESSRGFWRKLSLGSFTPMLFGIDASSQFSALTIKGRQKTGLSEASEVSEPELSKSKVFLKLVDKIERLVKVKREKVAELHKNYGSKTLGNVTLAMLFSGLKDVPAMVTETSELDPTKGIRFRGLTVDEMLRKLPGKNEDCPYTESVLWYLLTGEVPEPEDVKELSRELHARSAIPHHVFEVMESMPRDSHPLTQYVTAVSALQTESVFRKAYLDKTYQKDTSWKLALEDCLNLVAKNVVLVGFIYRRSFIDPTVKPEDVKFNAELDYAANLAHFLGDKTELFSDLMRLYLALHSDHEAILNRLINMINNNIGNKEINHINTLFVGGNVSAHASHLVGSALADPYFCLASALCGLSGPLHGMANQECLVWIKRMLRNLGPNTEITVERVKKYAEDTMAAGQVIPGYGHAVLKVTDPRHTAFVRFARTHFPNDPMVRLLDICLEAIPQVLIASDKTRPSSTHLHEYMATIANFNAGKVRNPNPNVDCSTGVLLSHFNIDQPQVFTVFFGLSRSLGILSQLVWARALRYPIERPKSLTLDTVERMCTSPEEPKAAAS
ncbi:citrate synthase, mitochondrial precursor [Theileria orientalis strain Shintoku]|uniref:Citrate synthase, mitochondrial n=1 Tax=Theileria orientalis strain Shintoku TaxID=869250 RepID=J4D7V7_THEOR|nr:citrate synthase, mitochondrial precursor [Theileria orientalis strain Shintoku]BAM40395.1 citrate synthase, mitochondrial precursor [Theileria orientalis strain Shintoku]|eukprot:XP_009690696.1 citrate synthase, mitochondrial precursor [Theileria orientalis strain Shintoku]